MDTLSELLLFLTPLVFGLIIVISKDQSELRERVEKLADDSFRKLLKQGEDVLAQVTAELVVDTATMGKTKALEKHIFSRFPEIKKELDAIGFRSSVNMFATGFGIGWMIIMMILPWMPWFS